MSFDPSVRKKKKVDCEKLCPEWECRQPGEFEGIWVIGEIEDGKIHEASLQMLTPARDIANKLQTWIEGVLIGGDKEALEEAAKEMIYHGADKVRIIYHPDLKVYSADQYALILSEVAKQVKPEVIFVAATLRGREFGPYIANTLRAGITADCTNFDVDMKTGDVVMIRPPFGAIMLAHIKTPTRRPQMGTARPNVFPVPERDESREGEITWVELDNVPPKRTFLEEVKIIPQTEVPIEKADYIVSGGRGVATKELWSLLEELAKELGAVVAGSRKAVDMGFIPHEKQVGQTGKTVKPKLYIAVGISGAAQHTFGIREAGIVVAINKDPDAPIFKAADYGIVGDAKDILPLLIEEIRKLKQQSQKSN
ncbi:MAG: electron transfer flavoprotein subunit alpha/FixB family protein [Desulfurococcales archaeon]|nr:electron transfer flavoprotein subunit alpha/FixB family protein [Desulfurococcales archaeon]MEB3759090.1 electron transfer flavoprotein subunit alpha/FixB family protein [Desulfurococcales archaeon]MEB3773135.1 electron transfer flavoprotein subunit alpha/FixB family protein [Desulfurococcales archaeon]MEB3786761.1 electron transfer flavoprotein subunit alpha/FixB family protein [Desulfurococcales archaeon]MEB3799132.1 electron transfer flavoprotein subunit alpha/FixB family protein [Desulf